MPQKPPAGEAPRLSASDFDVQWYLDSNPDVRATGVDPWRQAEGRRPKPPSPIIEEGRRPKPPSPIIEMLQKPPAGEEPRLLASDFDVQWYLDSNPDVRATGVDPWEHYQSHGQAEGRRPKPPSPIIEMPQKPPAGEEPGLSASNFDVQWYLDTNPDIRAAGVDPWEHYQSHGQAEGRRPKPPAPIIEMPQKPPAGEAPGLSASKFRCAMVSRHQPRHSRGGCRSLGALPKSWSS